MLHNPFPDHISFCLLPIHSTSNQKLHPAEENYFSQLSSVSRKEHYRSGRICAGEVLSKLGTLGQPVLRDPQTREPLCTEVPGFVGHARQAVLGFQVWKVLLRHRFFRTGSVLFWKRNLAG